MTRRKRVLLAAGIGLLAALLVYCLWYSRPVTVYDLGLDKEPDVIGVSVSRVEGFEVTSRSVRLEREDEDFQELLDLVSALEFRHCPTNPILRMLPFFGGNKVLTAGKYDYHISIALAGAESETWDGYLSYAIGGWTYRDVAHDASVPLYSETAVDDLGDALWDKLPEE